MLRLLTNLKTLSLLVEPNDNWLDQLEWDVVSSVDFDPAHRTADSAYPTSIIFHKPLDTPLCKVGNKTPSSVEDKISEFYVTFRTSADPA